MKDTLRVIWVVDDDFTYRNFLMEFLKILGYATKGFETGEECLRHLNEKPDVILLDHNLSGELNGLDILRSIKSEAGRIPVIYITAAKEVEIASDAYRNGASDFIHKNSASLLRLKLQLERLGKVKMLERKKVIAKRSWIFIAAILLILALITSYHFFLQP
jgi:DNA-binding NtrC family response regulator